MPCSVAEHDSVNWSVIYTECICTATSGGGYPPTLTQDNDSLSPSVQLNVFNELSTSSSANVALLAIWKKTRWTESAMSQLDKLSHADTVVPECYKDDVESLWENVKFDRRHPKTCEPMVTNIWYLPRHKNFITLPPPAHICETAYRLFCVLTTHYSQGRYADFDAQYFVISHKDHEGCAFWVTQNGNFTFWPHFLRKTQIFGRFSTGRFLA